MAAKSNLSFIAFLRLPFLVKMDPIFLNVSKSFPVLHDVDVLVIINQDLALFWVPLYPLCSCYFIHSSGNCYSSASIINKRRMSKKLEAVLQWKQRGGCLEFLQEDVKERWREETTLRDIDCCYEEFSDSVV